MHMNIEMTEQEHIYTCLQVPISKHREYTHYSNLLK